MSLPRVNFERIVPAAMLPTKGTPESACYDLYAGETVHWPGHQMRIVVGTGLKVEIPPGYMGLIYSRSGLAAKDRIFVLNSPGIIDEDYRGELKVILGRLAKDIAWPCLDGFEIREGSRIAQFTIVPQIQFEIVEVPSILANTTRGTGGLGSTGV